MFCACAIPPCRSVDDLYLDHLFRKGAPDCPEESFDNLVSEQKHEGSCVLIGADTSPVQLSLSLSLSKESWVDFHAHSKTQHSYLLDLLHAAKIYASVT